MGGKVIDDGVEFIIGPIGAFVHHIGYDQRPAVFRIAVAQNNLRRVTSAADLLDGLFPGAIGELGGVRSSQGRNAREEENSHDIMHAVTSMRRRNFVRSLLISPIAPAVLAEEQKAANTKAIQPPPEARTPVRQFGPTEVPHLPVIACDLAARPAPNYFNKIQFATLQKLGGILQPPLKNNPGAIEAQAPEFLDFLISVSPEDRQKLYLSGLDSLEQQAKDKFQRSFCDLDAKQADSILRPLLVARPWPEDLPSDPVQNFIAQAHEDLRSATMNSREWALAGEKSGHRFSRGSRTSGYYWAPIDPISEG